ncbi:MAG: hypothetical protein CMQ24_22930, partial [Gammaproteobacteria bacterium]|nr:hypothetical protein [Gammaproteobacteria bacterium]
MFETELRLSEPQYVSSIDKHCALDGRRETCDRENGVLSVCLGEQLLPCNQVRSFEQRGRRDDQANLVKHLPALLVARQDPAQD